MVRMKGWTWLSAPQHPAAYLARLLREVEHSEPPGTTPLDPGTGIETIPQPRAVVSLPSRERADLERSRRDRQAAELAERHGHALCDHGVGGADPDTGTSTRCAFCRREGSR